MTGAAGFLGGLNLNRNIVEFRDNKAITAETNRLDLNRNIVEFRGILSW